MLSSAADQHQQSSLRGRVIKFVQMNEDNVQNGKIDWIHLKRSLIWNKFKYVQIVILEGRVEPQLEANVKEAKLGTDHP